MDRDVYAQATVSRHDFAGDPLTDDDDIKQARAGMDPIREAIDICTSIHAQEQAMASINDLNKQTHGTDVDWDDIDQSDGFDPIPEGEYALEVAAEEVNENKKGTGHLLKIKWTILGPAYAGRVVFSQHNVVHQNETAQAIGRRELREIAEAGGIGPQVLEDTSLLVGVECHAFIGIEEWEGNDGQMRTSNRPKNFEAPDGQPSGPKEGATSGGTSGTSGTSGDWSDSFNGDDTPF